MMDEMRCKSIGVMPMGPVLDWPRCELPLDHEEDHEGKWRSRKVLWDYSPVTVGEDDPSRFEEVS